MLKKYDLIQDFIVFGSFVKGNCVPQDLDIAIIAPKKDVSLVGEINIVLNKYFKNVHLQLITYEEFIRSKFPYYALLEGYSVREGNFLSKKLGIKRTVLFTFNLEGLLQTKKVMFNKALRSLVATTKSEKVGRGAVLVPVNKSKEFEDLLSLWKRKIRKKELIEI